VATRKKQEALATYDEELAKLASEYADQEAGVGGGSFFSTRGGKLTYGDAPLPNNQMAVVILDGILENSYYTEDYNPDSPSSPVCYAFGRSEDEMCPHAESTDPQAKGCAGCPNNQWGSAARGRGKACANRRRLALISAGRLDASGGFEFDTPEQLAKAEIGFLRLPPTSLKGYATYVKQIAKVQKLPPFGVATLVSLESDPKTQFRLCFEQLQPAPKELHKAILERHKEARDLIEFPYKTVTDADEVNQPAAKAPARKTRAKKKF